MKIHPSDRRTTYDHMHIYDKFGKPLDKNLSTVSRRHPGAHIEITPMAEQTLKCN